MSKNRFAGLQAVKKLQEEREVESKKVVEEIPTPTPKPIKITEKKPKLQQKVEEIYIRRGRPSGKRSNADFQQVTAYIRRETYKRVTIKLIENDQRGEFSELVEELLQKWLKR